jgi:hypothetical protein
LARAKRPQIHRIMVASLGSQPARVCSWGGDDGQDDDPAERSYRHCHGQERSKGPDHLDHGRIISIMAW